MESKYVVPYISFHITLFSTFVFMSPQLTAMSPKEFIIQQCLKLERNYNDLNLYFEHFLEEHLDDLFHAYPTLFHNNCHCNYFIDKLLNKKNIPFVLDAIEKSQTTPGCFEQTLSTCTHYKQRYWALKTTIRYVSQIITDRIKNDDSIATFKTFFSSQPEGILKTILRIIYYQKKFLRLDDTFIQFLHPPENNCFQLDSTFKKTLYDGVNLKIPNLEHLLEIIPLLYDDPIYELDLSNNDLKELPESIACMRDLKKIKLDKNALTSLPDILFRIPNLKTLVLDQDLALELFHTGFALQCGTRGILFEIVTSE